MAKAKDVFNEIARQSGRSLFSISKEIGMGVNIYTSIKNEDGIRLSTLKKFFKATNTPLVIKVGNKEFELENDRD